MNEKPQIKYQIGRTSVSKIGEMDLNGIALTTLLPDLEPKTLKEHPSLFDARTTDAATGNALLSVHSWLVRTPSHTILIDVGAGNDKRRPKLPVLSNLHSPYLARLKDGGINPEDVDYVLLTHLHADHVGWNTRLVGDSWVPTFPNAQYVFSELEEEYGAGLAYQDHRAQIALEKAAIGEPIRKPLSGVYEDSLKPILDAGQAKLIRVDGREIVDGLSFLPTPGHSINHAAIALRSEDGEALFGGDIVHHPLEIAQPHLISMFCEFPEAARASRLSMLDYLARSGAMYFSSHFPSTSAGHVRKQGESYSWQFS